MHEFVCSWAVWEVSHFHLPLCVPSLLRHVKPARVSRTCIFICFVVGIFNFSNFLSTQIVSCTDLVQDQQQIGCAKKGHAFFHLDHLCTFVCSVVSKSAQSVGGDEIGVFSPVGMARAAAVPVEALEAGDLMGETLRGKKARYAEPADQTPDQKAEEIVKKTLRSNLEKTMLEDLQRVASKFFKLTNRLIHTREKYQSLAQQVQQIQ